jgi:hypothetical protein
MYSADEIMCAKALLSLRSTTKQTTVSQSTSASDRALRYERRLKTKAIKPKAKARPKPQVQEDECSRAERYERRCQAKAAEENREIAKRWRKNVLPVLRQMR